MSEFDAALAVFAQEAEELLPIWKPHSVTGNQAKRQRNHQQSVPGHAYH